MPSYILTLASFINYVIQILKGFGRHQWVLGFIKASHRKYTPIWSGGRGADYTGVRSPEWIHGAPAH